MTRSYHRPIPDFGSNREYTPTEELAYPLLTEAFTAGVLVNERYGFNGFNSIDWASATSGDHAVRVGVVHGGEMLLGLLVESQELGETYWVRSPRGDTCRLLASEGLESLTAVSASRTEKRKLRSILRHTKLVERQTDPADQ